MIRVCKCKGLPYIHTHGWNGCNEPEGELFCMECEGVSNEFSEPKVMKTIEPHGEVIWSCPHCGSSSLDNLDSLTWDINDESEFFEHFAAEQKEDLGATYRLAVELFLDNHERFLKEEREAQDGDTN